MIEENIFMLLAAIIFVRIAKGHVYCIKWTLFICNKIDAFNAVSREKNGVNSVGGAPVRVSHSFYTGHLYYRHASRNIARETYME